jgi:hypothetical protein
LASLGYVRGGVLDAEAGRLYVGDQLTSRGNLTIVDVAERRPVPIRTTLWNEPPDASGNVVVHASAESGFAPFAPPIVGTWLQADAIDGAWTRTTPAGAAGAHTFTLAPGAHEVHGFAADGQAIGPSTTLPIFVDDPQPHVDVELVTPVESIGAPGTVPIELRIVNGTAGPQTFALAVALVEASSGETFYLVPGLGMQLPRGVGFATAIHLPISEAFFVPGSYAVGAVVLQAGGVVADRSVIAFAVE